MIEPGDRIVVIGSPQAALEWSELIAPGSGKVRDVVIFGAGRAGTAIARQLLEQGIGVQADRSRSGTGQVDCGRAPGRPGLQRHRHGSGLPGAGADRRRAGRDLRDAGGHEEPLRGDARQAQRRPVHDRDRPRPRLDPGVRARRNRRHRQSASGHRRGDRPLRPRPADAAGRDARGRPVRGARHHDPPGQRVRREGLRRDADPRRLDRRDRPQRRRPSSRAATTCSGPATARSSSPSRDACPRSSGRCEDRVEASGRLEAPAPGRGRARHAQSGRHAHEVPQPRDALPGGRRARLRRVALALPGRGRDRRRRRRSSSSGRRRARRGSGRGRASS